MSECKREFHIAGDYIENQTNNFYDHSQYNSTGAVMNEKKGTDKRKSKTASRSESKSALPNLDKPKQEKPRERMTFHMRGTTVNHFKLLFQQMMADGWLAKENKEDDFLDLFSGQLSDCKIIWGDKYGKSTLVFFFKYLVTEGLISKDKGFTVPNILMGHFVDKEDNFLTDLDNGDKPNEKCAAEVMSYLEILKANANRQGRRARREDDDDDFTGYGEELSSHLEDEGLSYSTKPY